LPQQIIEWLGPPSEEQDLQEDLLDAHSLVYHYHDLDCSFFFDLKNHSKLVSLEISHPDTVLYETKVIGLSEKEITTLLRTKGFILRDSETHPWGEKRLSFDEAGLDCYFEHGKLCLIQCDAAYGSI
jgi:hypothetical protein